MIFLRNESKSIAKVIADYKAALPEADIYVYDNNSTDETDKIARDAREMCDLILNKKADMVIADRFSSTY